MLIKTSKDVYAYQCLAGSTGAQTAGLNFVAPVNCLLPDVMDNIPDIRNIAGTTVSGGVTIVAAVNTPDSNISVTHGGGNVTLPASRPVTGSTDWKTFFIPNLTGNVSVQSTGPLAVGFFGYNGNQGVAGYFSGFDTVPEVTLDVRGGTGCFVGSEIYEATGNFDAYQWFGDGVAIPGANGPSFAATKAGDYFVRGTKGPCTYDSQPLTALYCNPDIVVEKTVDKSEIMEGETATFTIKVRNLGVGPVTNLMITDNIPNGLTLQSTQTIKGTWAGNQWNIGTLNGGESAQLRLTVLGDEIDISPLLSVTNTVSNTQDQIDTNTTEDKHTARITIHNDYDNDGVKDITDLDDDNDGIYDQDECAAFLCFEPILNESFEDPVIPGSSYRIFNESQIPAWSTTSTDGSIEYWSNNFNGVLSFDGNQFAELNATQNSALYQNLCVTPGTVMEWSLRHRGRQGTDVMRVKIGADLGSAVVLSTISDDTSAWGYHSGTYTVPAGQTNTLFIFEAVSTFSGNLSVGNLIDDIQINIISAPICGDSDNDGIPDNLDLDSDGDGCSDANEFYKNENADGGDGGEYGAGTPVVDPNNGTVISASYTQVFSPQIVLENTSEDLGGNDINGQDVSLGQTFEYVLRFQNTGDDNAVNYTIKDILPNNVSLESVDISNAPGTTHTYNINMQTIDFAVPNSLVAIGQPEYSIRIKVKIALNCSDFVAACSSTLENQAYSTYNGVKNTTQFSDENGQSALTGCPMPTEIASNSILNDLTSCNQARTVQLCGDFAILQAGAGFTTYNWVLDSNGNGQVDSGENTINDQDPDNDPSTFIVSSVGNYIVEKSSNSGCPNLIERITVERFGETQTNPIISFFNQVNSDANPDNDIQGEIVTCSVDGSELPKIFLCGADDEATLQLGITDAQSIVWQKLDENSCSDSGDDCANKNGTCTWSTVETLSNYTVAESGEYRVVVNYRNGCFSRFYFNVFKNELNPEFNASDIICDTPGNIRITNVGSGYGFQLLNTITNTVIVPFSANNGPNFDITSNGTYLVQVTQLDPTDGTPIVGSCLFETDEIGIEERIFSVNLSSTPAACEDLGTITIQALNAFPNYSFELRLDDNSNSGQGTLVSNQTALNDNTYTFSSVNPGNYIVITRTQDGCFDSQKITVTKTPDLELAAITSQNISCTAGIITLTPNGGEPDPDYHMAIWSKNGTDLYNSASDIPTTALQTTTDFLFRDATEAGEYEFIVFDDSGCFAISNKVTVIDLGNLSLGASNSEITCADSASATLTVSVTGGTAPYQYSLDGGVSYQSQNEFLNLSAGIYTITVMDSGNNSGSGCIETLEYEITQPFRLTASASILEDASCDPNGALVKILNPNGGKAPYSYSFDGGSTFLPVDEQRLFPGSYQLAVTDALGCVYDMEITVPDPITDPTFTQSVIYDCTGNGEITITSSNTSDFNYTYSRNGSLNSPTDSGIFSGLAPGTHTITVDFASSLTPEQSTLFIETFGAGPTTQIGEIGSGYCYEPQDGSETNCNLGPAGILVNGEYTVTNFVTNPIPSWRNPNDHTAITDGRFLAIDVSTLAGDKGILWQRKGLEVLPNQEITLDLWAYNLMTVSGNGNNPEILVELVDGSGNVLQSITTPEIPKNNNPDDWHNRQVTLNPGTNTLVDIVLRSNLNSDFGNDLILDDIKAFQAAKVCESSQDITVVVESGKEFEANLLSTIDASCNGATDGAIRFEVSNFDAATGFEYAIGTSGWVTSLTSPVTTTANLAKGTYTVSVRKVNDNSCSTDFSVTVDDASPILPVLTKLTEYNCYAGATLKASATGGNPGYEYQLEKTNGDVIVVYQPDFIFTDVLEGNYVVRVQDQNGCDAVSANTISVTEPIILDFDLIPTACYDGENNATIEVSITTGNGDYKFKINGGSWVLPAAPNATTHTFTGLTNGLYDIQVMDSYGCISPVKSETISPAIKAQVEVEDVSSCADGSITVTPSGGTGSYAYAFLPTGTILQDSDFSASNTISVNTSNAGDFDIYVRDNNAINPYCEYSETATVNTSPALAFTPTPTDAICFGDQGSIAVNITSGLAPFTYELIDVDHATSSQTQNGVVGTTKTYYNLLAGTYNITITDATGCSNSVNGIMVNEPDELIANIEGETPATCTGDVNDFGFKFLGYPTTIGTIEFSADGGNSWEGDNSNPGTSDIITGYLSGSTVNPSMRTIDGAGNTICQTDFPPFIIPYPLDDLDITILPVIVNCNELQVSVRGENGTAPYQYTYDENPGNFNQVTPANGWTSPYALGITHTFLGLTPGRTYSFYVRDAAGCVRQSNVNVNDLPSVTNPMEISATFEPSCSSMNDGEITYSIVDTDGTSEPEMIWNLYDINDNLIASSGPSPIIYSNTITVAGLAENTYYIVVQQFDSSGNPQCISGSENLLLEELDPITGTTSVLKDISCESPGLIAVSNVQGGGGSYTYTITGPSPFTTITNTSNNPIEIPANSPTGSYHVSVSDQFGCSYSLGNVTMSLSANPAITATSIAACGASTTVTITATSPSSSILYSLDGGATYKNNAGVFQNVVPGTYSIFVKDGDGCTDSGSIEVFPSLQARASQTRILGCGTGNEGELTLEVTAGSNDYEYEILDTSGTLVSRQAMTSNSIPTAVTVADTYTVNVYDVGTGGPECSRSFIIEVAPAVTPDFTPIPTDVSCSGGSDGSIFIDPVLSGYTPYTYSILPTAGTFNTSTNSYGGLPEGTYEITAVATNGCEITKSNIIVNDPDAITFDIPTITPFSCTTGNTKSNALISINNISGGSGNYVRYEFIADSDGSMLQASNNPNYIFTDKNGGDVRVRVIDSYGCSNQITIIVAPYDELGTPSIIIDDAISCSNFGEDISIDIASSVTNFTSNPTNYQFKQLPLATFQSSNQFNDLQPGYYTFVIKNISTGCEVLLNHTVKEPNTFGVSVNKIADVVCFGDNGSISLNITDATYGGQFSYQIFETNDTPNNRSDDGAAVHSNTIIGVGTTGSILLPAGNYLVEVTQDAFPGCKQIRSFNINGPSAEITLDAINFTEVGCTNNLGSASIKPLGGRAPYSIQLTNTTTTSSMGVSNANSNLFQGLGAGQYTVAVTDALGCLKTFTNAFELLLPDPITGTALVTNLVCHEDKDAAITVNLDSRNITTNYRYQLKQYDLSGSVLLKTSASQTSNTFANLSAGNYEVLVFDDMGCSYIFPKERIEAPTEVTAQLTTVMSLSCQAGAILELRAQGGTGSYSWSEDGISFTPMNNVNGAGTHVFENLTVGNYQYYVSDSYNCISTFSNEIAINTIETLTVTVDTDAAFINCNGESSALIEAFADGGLGNYEYGLFADVNLSNPIIGYQNFGLFADLPQGTYFVSVRSEDCFVTSEEIQITEPQPLAVDSIVTNVMCNGEDNGSVSFNVTGGTGTYQYSISPNLNQFDDKSTFADLSPGAYRTIIQDANGCFELVEFTITEPEVLEMELSATPEICAGEQNGAIMLTITGGTAPYSSALNANEDSDFVEGRTIIDNLAGGDYIVFVKDANGCITNQIISVENGANLNADVEVIYECTGDVPNSHVELKLQDETISDNVMYGLDSVDPNDFILEANFDNLSAGSHYITIAHANGCVNTINFEVEGFEPLTLSLTQENLNEITATAEGGRGEYTFYFEDKDTGADNTYFIGRTDDYLVRVVDENGCEATAVISMEFIDIEIPNFFTPDGDGLNDKWVPRNIEQFPNIFIKIFDRNGREVYLIKDNDEGWDGLYNKTDLPTGDYWYIIKLNGERDEREFVGNFTLYR